MHRLQTEHQKIEMGLSPLWDEDDDSDGTNRTGGTARSDQEAGDAGQLAGSPGTMDDATTEAGAGALQTNRKLKSVAPMGVKTKTQPLKYA